MTRSMDSPGLELGVRALAGRAQFRVRPVGGFLRFRLALPLIRDLRVGASPVALIGQGDQARGLQLGQDAPDPLGLLVVHRAGQRPGHPQDVAVRAGDDLQIHPVLLVLAGVEGPVRGDPVDRDQGPVQDDVGVPGLLRVPDRLAELRCPGREQGHGLVPRISRQSWCRPRTRPRARRTSRLSAGRPGPEAPAARGSASASTTRSRPGGGG